MPIAVVAAPEDGVDKHTEILKSRSKKVEILNPLHFVEHSRNTSDLSMII